MYHCHVRLYLTGHPCRVFELIKEMSPMKNFSYEFLESGNLETDLISGADVILVHLQDLDVKETLQTIKSHQGNGAELILLLGKDTVTLEEEELWGVKDFWSMPMSDAEIRFKISLWQQEYKLKKDLWETDHFLTATIDNTPNLIWYKDKDGIHEKVNLSFCDTVNKTREQVQGRGHAYIWDVEHDEIGRAHV